MQDSEAHGGPAAATDEGNGPWELLGGVLGNPCPGCRGPVLAPADLRPCRRMEPRCWIFLISREARNPQQCVTVPVCKICSWADFRSKAPHTGDSENAAARRRPAPRQRPRQPSTRRPAQGPQAGCRQVAEVVGAGGTKPRAPLPGGAHPHPHPLGGERQKTPRQGTVSVDLEKGRGTVIISISPKQFHSQPISKMNQASSRLGGPREHTRPREIQPCNPPSHPPPSPLPSFNLSFLSGSSLSPSILPDPGYSRSDTHRTNESSWDPKREREDKEP